MGPERTYSQRIRKYEGLVRKTASMTVDYCELEFDDICQLYRIKAWKAVESFDPSQVKNPEAKDKFGRTPEDRYVYLCIKNQQKDLCARKRHNPTYIEDMSERFEAGFLSVAAGEVFDLVEDEMPGLPFDLSDRELRIIAMLYLDLDNGEIGAQLGIKRKQVATLVRGIQQKMREWAPEAWLEAQEEKARAKAERVAAPLPPPMTADRLPVAA